MASESDGSSGIKRSRPPYSGHRSHSDASAHAHSALAEAPAVHRHPLACGDSPQLVTEQTQLRELVDHLRSAKSFAYDSEFIGELTYIPRLCLIQAASTQRVALIDPLAKLDLTPFWELVADGSVEKIVHAGQQDVEPVFRAIQRPPANLFDTQICGGFVGLGYPLSLSKLVFCVVGAKLSKGLTFTHWDRRPLSDYQLRYAADDVRYLPAVRHALGERLSALGHAAWASEESATLADPRLYAFDPDTQVGRIRGATGLPPRQLAVLRELTIWRDQAARQEDVPPRSLLKDEVLLALAKNPSEELEALSQIRGLPRPVESAHGQDIVNAVRRAFAMPGDQLPVSGQREVLPEEKSRADGLAIAAQAIAAGRQIDPALVASRQEIGELYRLLAEGRKNPELPILRGWRREAVGQVLIRLFQGEIKLSLDWKLGSLHSLPDEL
jgi:ribonuclease D